MNELEFCKSQIQINQLTHTEIQSVFLVYLIYKGANHNTGRYIPDLKCGI